MGGYGLSIYLDPLIALRFKEFKRNTELTDTLQEDARAISQSLFPDDYDEIVNPYQFLEDSLLLQNCKVPGFSCDLGADFDAIERLCAETPRGLEFRPHNIDGFTQASALLSLWLNWFNTAKSFV